MAGEAGHKIYPFAGEVHELDNCGNQGKCCKNKKRFLAFTPATKIIVTLVSHSNTWR
jgi:hypothetical protein